MLRSDDLLRFQVRVRQEQHAKAADLKRLETRRTALFLEGTRETSERMRLAIARQVRGIEVQMAGIQKMLMLLDRQAALAGQLVFAQENKDRLERAPFLGLDWDFVLASVAQAGVDQSALAAKLDALLSAFVPLVKAAPPASSREEPPIQFPARLQGEVARAISVPDGDGLKLEDGRKVRYIGVNAPEMHTWENGPQPWAREAKEFNRRLVEGQMVRMVKDVSETDRYGRLLRFVYVGDICVNTELLRMGLARVMTLQPDCSRAAAFEKIEERAALRRVGLWERAL